MNKKNYFHTYISLSLLFGALLAFVPSILSAEPKGPRPGGPLGVFFSSSLGLTSDQKTSIKAVLESYKSAVQSDHSALDNAHSNLSTYLKGGGSDSTQLDVLTSSCGAAEKAMQNDEAKAFVAAYAILTSDQKALLPTLSDPTPPSDHHKANSSSKPKS